MTIVKLFLWFYRYTKTQVNFTSASIVISHSLALIICGPIQGFILVKSHGNACIATVSSDCDRNAQSISKSLIKFHQKRLELVLKH